MIVLNGLGYKHQKLKIEKRKRERERERVDAASGDVTTKLMDEAVE